MLLKQKHLPLPVECVPDIDIDKIAKIVCSFLNTQGGWLVIGVDDDHQCVGVENVDTEKDIQRNIIHFIFPLPLVYIQKETYKNKTVILITVIKGSLPPYSYKNKYYILKGDAVVVPSSDDISRLMRDSFSVKSTWESVINVYADKDSLNDEQIGSVYKRGLSSGRLPESNDGLYSILSELQLVNSYEIKNGAVALFADNINYYLPQCRVRIQLMSKGKTSEKFDDHVILQGNIFKLHKEIMRYFKDRLPMQSFFLDDKTTRVDDYIYPLDVLDEAVSNALIHRDYSDISDEVTIFVFSDKIEITNPGSLPEKMIKSKNEVLPHGSLPRNPLMAEIFYIAGEMEKTGRGLSLISEKMKSLGKKLPEWIISNDRTILRIYNKQGKVELNERIEKFLEFHSVGDIFSKTEYMDFFDKKPSKITAQTDIQSMLNRGLCIKIGNGPATKYRII